MKGKIRRGGKEKGTKGGGRERKGKRKRGRERRGDLCCFSWKTLYNLAYKIRRQLLILGMWLDSICTSVLGRHSDANNPTSELLRADYFKHQCLFVTSITK